MPGVVAPTEGEILVGGEPLPTGEPSESMARGVGTIYQELDLVDDLTVAESVFLGHEVRRGAYWIAAPCDARPRNCSSGSITRTSPRTRESARCDRRASRSSRSRVRCRKIRLLIMDEPSAILDDHEIETLFGVVRRLTEQGVGVIYISHRLDEVRRIGDRVTVLSDGRTVAVGLPPDTPTDKLVEHMVGRKVEQLYPERQKRSGDVLLEVRGVGREPEIKPASFEVHAGEIVGIGGLVGAGRTELLRLIYGLAVTTARWWSTASGCRGAAGRGDRRRARLAPEDRKSQGLLLEWSLANNVTLADLGKYRRRGLLSPRAERKAAASCCRS